MYSASTLQMEHNAPLYPSLAQESIRNVLQLIRSENVGPVTFFQLISRYKTAEKALRALPMLALRGGAKRTIHICPASKVDAEMERTQRFGAQFIPYGHAHYPALLMQVNDPPPVIVAHGHTHLLGRAQMLAMVGSRNASANGCRYATKLATELGQKGFTVASGLARGIDGHAHKGALASGTVAVIAGGIDHIYPPEHASLFSQIAEQGVIVSESPFNAAPKHRHFPARNRIIAGMSQGTIVVEATQKSGSLITAKFALGYHRDIFAVPGFPMDPRSAGTNQLIQQGAMLVNSAHDIVDSLHNKPAPFQDSTLPGLFSTADADFSELDTLLDEENLDRERQIVLDLIGSTPLSVEELMAMAGVDARIVNIILLELELAGMITRHSGGGISRNYEYE